MKKQTNNADQDKKCLQALKVSNERFRSIVHFSPDAIIVTDAKGKIEYMNPAAEKVFNRKLESFVGKDFGLALVNGESTEIDIIRPGKEPGVGDMYVVQTEWMGEKAHLITIRDITGRKRTEEELREARDYLDKLIGYANAPIITWDSASRITLFNHAFERLTGYTAEEVVGKELFTLFPETSRDKSLNKIMHTSLGEYWESADLPIRRKDGVIRIVLWNSANIYDQDGKTLLATIAQGQDITERKQSEEKLLESKILTEVVVENVPLMTFLKEATDLRFVIFNRAGEELLGYDRKDLLGKNDLDLFPPEQEAHSMAKDREVLDGETGILDIPEEPILTAKKGELLLHTRKVCIRGADGETKYLLGISEDITERKQAEKQLHDILERLRKSFEATIQVLISAVEMRDPYTSGHQLRVANLASAIAKEMELPDDEIEGIRMAGSIHDIRKLSVPAEILSKPTKLTNIEFSLIKEHSHSGYEMLKDVESPWPLAQIVYQHHERMDGSGYPRNLKGEEICMEARILAVADVVEAMASHRPYRPALGIDAALTEIEKNKGIFYDNDVADACLRLFREKGFQLEVT